ncbi:MAG TPA: hypothetical protein PKI49_11055 [Pseudomonadota bacterium]|nr:hypothetical protein [Pseudomonadota bacterium]HNO69038.1 hypothetical protein [Pseudomonadota bacterium]
MKPLSPIRFPLSIGSTPANLALGICVIGFFGAGPVFFGSLLPDFVAIVCGLLIALWFFGLCMLPFSYRKERASDLVVGPEGIQVFGGRFSTKKLGWSQLAQDGAIALSKTEPSADAPALSELSLGGEVMVRSEESDAHESLAALHESLCTFAEGYLDANMPAQAPVLDPRVLHCPSCGAPQPATNKAHLSCLFCGAQVPVPSALQEAVHSAMSVAEDRVATRKSLQELTRWPRARFVNQVLAIAMFPLALSWPLMAAFTSEFFQYYDILRWRDVFILFFATCSMSLGMVLFLQSQLVLRRAFALISASFHALPPEDGQSAYRCRSCAAPIVTPEQIEEPLFVCPYCRCDNVILGALLPHTVHTESEQRQSLDALLVERKRTRNRWRLGIVVSVLLIGAGGQVACSAIQRVKQSSLPRHAPVDRTWSYEPGWVKQ